jgi:gamma-glutamylcyclotransferase (GGCT)/AIG2-like uncharacterized protein YtfP
MALLFSYGTLQQEDVQLSTFGRRLDGKRDELPRFEAARVGPHANAQFNGREESRVAGTVFEITDAELAAADRFEAPFSYKRIAAVLTSGRQAWLYVHAEE